MNRSSKTIQRIKVKGNSAISCEDVLAIEEPLDIRIVSEHEEASIIHPIAVTMRTPTHDDELAVGFLLSEGALPENPEQVDAAYLTEDDALCNVMLVRLKGDHCFDPKQLSRHVLTSSSCGICGKLTIEDIRNKGLHSPVHSPLNPQLLMTLPQKLNEAQQLFKETGGLHASALFTLEGELLMLREDVGRHNALDKILGSLYLKGQLPATDRILLLSGRISFELVQKAISAGIGTIAAIGAPSSLAVDLACEFNLNLVGFLKKNQLNIYHQSKPNDS